MSYTLTNLTANTTYYLAVYGVNGMGSSPVVVLEAPGQTGSPAPPSPPTDLVCANRSDTAATIGWTMDDPGGLPLTGYRVFYEVGRVCEPGWWGFAVFYDWDGGTAFVGRLHLTFDAGVLLHSCSFSECGGGAVMPHLLLWLHE